MSGYWADAIGFSIVAAMLLTAVLGLALAAVMPGMDRWGRRFFVCFFTVFALCMCSIVVESVAEAVPAMAAAQKVSAWLESLLTSVIVAMPALYLLHCCGEGWRGSALLRAVLALWAVFLALLMIAQLTTAFYYYTPDNRFVFGPWYPLLGAPMVATSALILASLIRRRGALSRRRFYALLVFLVPLTVAMAVHMVAPSFLLLYAGVATSSLAMFVIVMSEEVEQHMSLQRETARQRAKLAVLQMRPHFIHNTMTSIYHLCEEDSETAQRVTMDFDTYLRKNFNAIVKDEAIPFAEELEHARAYLAVEQAQYKSKLVVELDTPHTRFHVPPLTLQPLAENAVKHGMRPETVPLRVCIRTRKAEAGSVIVVEDNGPGFDASVADDPRTTLANVRQRLQMMCGGSLEIAPREGGGSAVKVTVPKQVQEPRAH